jgi:hypothetical protein
MLSGDATRPPSFERVLERLGFSEPLEWMVHPRPQQPHCNVQLSRGRARSAFRHWPCGWPRIWRRCCHSSVNASPNKALRNGQHGNSEHEANPHPGGVESVGREGKLTIWGMPDRRPSQAHGTKPINKCHSSFTFMASPGDHYALASIASAPFCVTRSSSSSRSYRRPPVC